jgi:transcriptional regulator
MYIPRAFQETDRAELLRFMTAHNFAMMTSLVEGQLMTTHLPLVVWQEDEDILCAGHFAKANPHWRVIESQRNLIVFTGPHAYISPTLYDKAESVPTWNYMTVHAYGTAHLLTDEDASARLMNRLIQQHEPSYQAQWESLPETYRQGMMQGVVGFEIVLDTIEGKFKLSQNKTVDEQRRISAALQHSAFEEERQLGALMSTRLSQ